VSAHPPAYVSHPPTGRIIDVAAMPRLVTGPPPIPSTPPPIQAAAPPSSDNTNLSDRLRKLEDLFQQKFISNEEYLAKRQHILNEI
jgi:hypothetical protein